MEECYPWVFFTRFLNYTTDTKSRKACHISQINWSFNQIRNNFFRISMRKGNEELFILMSNSQIPLQPEEN